MTKEERAELYKDSIGYECVEIDDTDDVGELMSWGEVVRDIKNSYIQGATEQEQIDKNIIKSILGSIIILAQDQTISNIVKEIEIFAMIENALEESK